ncbi:DUF4239 domain-containing protein [Streptomyces sp. NBC_00876]|uniref:bestrophin-like domain n=1 Tax=Streptomyces sp. NBC_00876 TaxID=2975853 RepID=UPI0038632B57|nr:DUF4239 domain-containing protein [Streptomyces sp. NBC_00876]
MTEIIAVVLGVAMLAAACVLVRHRYWPPDPDEEPREDVAEYISMMVGVLYALILGLSLVSVWETRSSAQDHVQTEAGAAHQVYLLADGLPAARTEQVRTTMQAYVHHVVRAEFPEMVAGRPLGAEGWNLLHQVRAANRVPDSATPVQQATVQEVLAQLSTLDAARRGREADALDSLSPTLWLGLIIGGALTVAFMFMFGVKRNLTHVTMVMGLTALITFTVVLVYQLNQPFSGLLALDTSPFTRYFQGS